MKVYISHRNIKHSNNANSCFQVCAAFCCNDFFKKKISDSNQSSNTSEQHNHFKLNTMAENQQIYTFSNTAKVVNERKTKAYGYKSRGNGPAPNYYRPYSLHVPPAFSDRSPSLERSPALNRSPAMNRSPALCRSPVSSRSLATDRSPAMNRSPNIGRSPAALKRSPAALDRDAPVTRRSPVLDLFPVLQSSPALDLSPALSTRSKYSPTSEERAKQERRRTLTQRISDISLEDML